MCWGTTLYRYLLLFDLAENPSIYLGMRWLSRGKVPEGGARGPRHSRVQSVPESARRWTQVPPRAPTLTEGTTGTSWSAGLRTLFPTAYCFRSQSRVISTIHDAQHGTLCTSISGWIFTIDSAACNCNTGIWSDRP